MKKLILIFVVIATLGLCCKDEPTKPPDLAKPPTNCEYPPGNRSFKWRLDTVAWFPSWLGGVHAFSDTDAYVMGNIFQVVNGVSKGFLGLHWNGTKWDTNIYGTATEIKHVANDVTGDDHFMVSVGYWSINSPKPGLGEFNNTTKKWKGYQFETQGELRSVWTDGKGFFIAVGDNGMVYTKDEYTADWVYQKAPTEFSFYKLTGVSKNEIFILGYIVQEGREYSQLWKYYGTGWIKLLDNRDTLGTYIKMPEAEQSICDIAVNRCKYTDSLKLYIVGWESFLFEARAAELVFKKTNLSNYGLPLRSIGRTAQRIFCFTPNDIWIFGSGYNYHHWNGENFVQMAIPGFPSNIDDTNIYCRMQKTSTGKIFFPAMIAWQVYVVIQGTL